MFGALASPEVRWIEVVGGGLRFINWDRHNGKSSKARALDTEKKRRQRKMSRKCPDANGTKTGPEKRREEKSINPLPLCSELDTPEMRAAWADWIQHRKEIRKPAGKIAQKNALAKLAGLGPSRALAALKHSMANGWQGIFEPREEDQPDGEPERKLRYLRAEPDAE
jgi:hypothetical protein